MIPKKDRCKNRAVAGSTLCRVHILCQTEEHRAICEHMTNKGKKEIKCQLFTEKGKPFCREHQKMQDEIDTNKKEKLRLEEEPEEDNSEERKKFISGNEAIKIVNALHKKYWGDEPGTAKYAEIVNLLYEYREVLRATFFNNSEIFVRDFKKMKTYHEKIFKETEVSEDEEWIDLMNQLTELKIYYEKKMETDTATLKSEHKIDGAILDYAD